MAKAARFTLLLAIVATAVPGEAVNFPVDSTADDVDAAPGDGLCATAGGACTLRAAIQEANAKAGDDTIDVPAGTYILSIAGAGENSGASGDLDISGAGDLTLTGAGATTTIIDGAALDRVLHVGAVFGNAYAISDVTIRNGLADSDGGGGILSSGELTLERVIVRDNHTPTGSGGGIANVIGGTLQMRNSVVTGNSANRGGGVHQFVDSIGMTLSNVTISGNNATGSGGGLNDSAFTARLHNVTITNNTADSDADGNGDGGGFSGTFQFLFGPNVVLRNTIVAGNLDSGGEAPDCVLAAAPGVITSEGYNLIGDITGCAITGDLTGNVTGVAPLLGALADNGGGTLTHALLAGSPAIDAGNPAAPGSGGTACEATDQRGDARPVGPRCDIGAFEGGVSATVLDHYKCYSGIDLKNPPFVPEIVDTMDQLGSETVEVKKVKFVCIPVDKNGEGISNPGAYLTCYQVKNLALAPRPNAQVSTQFQVSSFELRKAKLLCVPSSMTVLP